MADSRFINDLAATLQQITAPSTAGIKAASDKLQNTYYTQWQTVPALIQLLQQHPDSQIRQLAGVEARKLVPKFWAPIDQDVQGVPENIRAEVRQSILESTVKEQQALVRHTSSRVVAAIAIEDIDDQRWADLLPFLFKGCTSDDSALREVSVYILYALLDADSESLIEGSVDLLRLFSQTVKDEQSSTVRVNTVLALGKVSENIDTSAIPKNAPKENNPVELYRAVIPSMVDVLKDTIAQNDEKAALQVFEVFTTLLLVDNALVAKHLGDLIQFMQGHIASNKELDEEIRVAALQFLISAVRFKKGKIQNLKLGPTLTVAALRIAAEPFEDDEDDEDENSEDSPGKLALRLIDVMSSSMAPTQVMAPLLEALPQCAASGDAYERRAGFYAVSAAVEGAPDFVATHIHDVLNIVVAGLNDKDHVVKVAALYALSQLATELHDVVGDEHAVLLPLVFNIMDGASTLKVGKAACLTLDAILETLDRDVITEKYLSSLVPKLLQLLQNVDNLTLKGSIVAALASAAFAAKQNFTPYFQPTIEALAPFVQIAGSTDDTIPQEAYTLCGMTMDALSSIADAVGKEVFRPYVSPLVDAAYSCLTTNKPRLKECGFVFLGIMAKVYKDEFAPYLDKLMPEIYKCLDQDEFGGADDEDEDDNDENIGQDDDGEDPFKLKVNGAVAIEKEVALESLTVIMTSTKEAFAPHLEKTTQTFVEQCDHFYDGIRKAAVVGLWSAFMTFFKLASIPKWTPGFPASTQGIPQPVVHLADTARKTTLDLLTTEDERSVATVICDNFAESIRLAGPFAIGSEEDLKNLVGELLMILQKKHSSQDMDDLDEEFDKHADEEDAIGDGAEYDEVLVDSAMDVLIQLAAALGGQFIPILQASFEVIHGYCVSKSASERASGVGCLAEIVNGLRAEVTPFTSDLLQIFLAALDDKDLEVRSNASYGIGLICEFSGETELIKSQYMTILQKLQRLLKKVDKKQRKSFGREGENDNNARSLANACGCVARMARKYPDIVPISEVLPVLVGRLPLHEGFEENTPIFEFIIDLFQQKNAAVGALTSEIVDVFDQVFAQQAALEHEESLSNGPPEVKPFEDDALRAKVVELLKFIEQNSSGLVSSKPNLAKVIA